MSHLLASEIQIALKAGGADGCVDRAVAHMLSHFHVWRICDPSPVPAPATIVLPRQKEVCKSCLLVTGFLGGFAFASILWWIR